MRIVISKTAEDLGKRAADAAEIIIKEAICDKGIVEHLCGEGEKLVLAEM